MGVYGGEEESFLSTSYTCLYCILIHVYALLWWLNTSGKNNKKGEGLDLNPDTTVWTCMTAEKSRGFLGFVSSFIQIGKVKLLAPTSSRFIGRIIINYFIYSHNTIITWYTLTNIRGPGHMRFAVSVALLIRRRLFMWWSQLLWSGFLLTFGFHAVG